jgi:hypothetical protein
MLAPPDQCAFVPAFGVSRLSNAYGDAVGAAHNAGLILAMHPQGYVMVTCLITHCL